MKKSRRGLGRGLGALIQSTVPEDQDPHIEEAASVADTTEPDDNPRIASNQPKHAENSVLTSGDKQDAEAVSSAREPDVDAAETPTADLEAATADHLADAVTAHAAEDADRSLADRYLKGSGRTPAGTASGEYRRPVDIFFPEKKQESSAPVGQEQSSRKVAPGGNGRKRPTMPSLEPRTRKPTPSRAVTDADPDQPSEAEMTVTDAPAAAEDKTTSQDATSVSGSIGHAELRAVSVSDIHPNPRQPREVFDEEDMEELVASIRQVGVLQPVVVRPVDGPSPYELVMGERRWRATQRAGLETIPAIVRHTADTELLRDALLENIHRSQLNPLEEAAAYEQLLEDFECTQDELSSRIGRSRPQISNTLRLLKLPPLVQRRVASGVLSAGHARALLGLVDPADMEKLAQKIVSEGLSVRATEELVSLHDGIRQAKPKARAPRSERHERLDYLANTLTDRLDTSVKITLGARKGKIAIDFASVEDLNRIMDLISPSGANDQ